MNVEKISAINWTYTVYTLLSLEMLMNIHNNIECYPTIILIIQIIMLLVYIWID